MEVIKEAKSLFECFFIVKLDLHGKTEILFRYPSTGINEKELLQYEKFCFPYKISEKAPIGQRHQHFTFMLTDLEKRHKYGFCKLTDGGKMCFCVMSVLPWFEIFYKVLNCMCSVFNRNDTETLLDLLTQLLEMDIPKPKDIVTISTSLTFCVPEQSVLPSIPENRNLMEYYSSVNPKTMMEIFAAFMFERRIIFVSSSLSVLTGCIFAAEALIFPLTWQHIYIPLLPPHIIDYCSAPMPFLVGLHTSLYLVLENTPALDDVVVVNIDLKTVENPFDDLESMPSESVSFLRSQLGKPNVAVGNNLAEAFLRTQARLIGCYRSALKYESSENAIVFEEDAFIEMHKPGSRRSFAEALVQLQTFQDFIDKRLEMLNSGVGFPDHFENEISEVQKQEGVADNTMYKEWLAVTKKGGELISTVRKKAKSNMKIAKESARQSMKDMKNAMKTNDEGGPSKSTLKSRQSLRENIRSVRPPRPAPPLPNAPRRSPPPRPPPPKSPNIRRYKMIRVDESEEEEDLFESNPSGSSSSLLDEINSGLKKESKDIPLLVDLSLDTPTPTGKRHSTNISNVDLLTQNISFNPAPIPKPRRTCNRFSPTEGNKGFNITSPHRASSIRRAEHVKVRPQRDYGSQIPQRPQTCIADDLFGLTFNTTPNTTTYMSSTTPTQNNSNWANFSNPSNMQTVRQGSVQGPSNISGNGTVKKSSNEPLISFDDF